MFMLHHTWDRYIKIIWSACPHMPADPLGHAEILARWAAYWPADDKHSSSPGMTITFNPRSYKLAFLPVWPLHCQNSTIKMKQGQLNSYFKKLTLVPESSNGDEQAGAAVEARGKEQHWSIYALHWPTRQRKEIHTW